MKLTYQPLPNEDVLRVSCEGNVSVRGKPPASEPLQELLGPHAYRQRVVLNLERADAADTSGLMWLVRTSNRFAQNGGRLVVYNFSPTFKQMLEVLGLISVIGLAASESVALDVLGRISDPVRTPPDVRPFHSPANEAG